MDEKKHKELLDKLKETVKEVDTIDFSSKDADITLLAQLATAMLKTDMTIAKDIAIAIFGETNPDLDKHIWKTYETLGREKFLVSYISTLRQSPKSDARRTGEQAAATLFGNKGSGSIFN